MLTHSREDAKGSFLRNPLGGIEPTTPPTGAPLFPHNPKLGWRDVGHTTAEAGTAVKDMFVKVGGVIKDFLGSAKNGGKGLVGAAHNHTKGGLNTFMILVAKTAEFGRDNPVLAAILIVGVVGGVAWSVIRGHGIKKYAGQKMAEYKQRSDTADAILSQPPEQLATSMDGNGLNYRTDWVARTGKGAAAGLQQSPS